jgi:hypothetical protein
MSECMTQRFRKLHDNERVIRRSKSKIRQYKEKKRKIGEAIIYKYYKESLMIEKQEHTKNLTKLL